MRHWLQSQCWVGLSTSWPHPLSPVFWLTKQRLHRIHYIHQIQLHLLTQYVHLNPITSSSICCYLRRICKTNILEIEAHRSFPSAASRCYWTLFLTQFADIRSYKCYQNPGMEKRQSPISTSWTAGSLVYLLFHYFSTWFDLIPLLWNSYTGCLFRSCRRFHSRSRNHNPHHSFDRTGPTSPLTQISLFGRFLLFCLVC